MYLGMLLPPLLLPQGHARARAPPQFDSAIADALHRTKHKLGVKGKLATYRFCDEVWTFLIENPNFKLDSEFLLADKVKIVACNAKPPPAAAAAGPSSSK
jgi:hypothetical protein